MYENTNFSPQTPAGITEKAPQFPQGGSNDSPLRSQPKETQAPVPPEKAPEQGWKTYRSLNYPYQINIPSSWNTDVIQFDGKKIDIFKGEKYDYFQNNISVFSEPVNKWVTVEDLTNNYFSHVKNYAPDATNVIDIRAMMKRHDEGESVRNFVSVLQNTYGDTKLVDKTISLSSIRIAGQKTEIVAAFILVTGVLLEKGYSTTALFLSEGQGWQISLSIKIGENQTETRLNEFYKILESFKLLK